MLCVVRGVFQDEFSTRPDLTTVMHYAAVFAVPWCLTHCSVAKKPDAGEREGMPLTVANMCYERQLIARPADPGAPDNSVAYNACTMKSSKYWHEDCSRIVCRRFVSGISLHASLCIDLMAWQALSFLQWHWAVTSGWCWCVPAGDAELKAWVKVQRPFLADDGSGLPLLCFRCRKGGCRRAGWLSSAACWWLPRPPSEESLAAEKIWRSDRCLHSMMRHDQACSALMQSGGCCIAQWRNLCYGTVRRM
jgi:hypothetical protein